MRTRTYILLLLLIGRLLRLSARYNRRVYRDTIHMKKALTIVLIVTLVLVSLNLEVTKTVLDKLRAALYPVFFGVLVALF